MSVRYISYLNSTTVYFCDNVFLWGGGDILGRGLLTIVFKSFLIFILYDRNIKNLSENIFLTFLKVWGRKRKVNKIKRTEGGEDV